MGSACTVMPRQRSTKNRTVTFAKLSPRHPEEAATRPSRRARPGRSSFEARPAVQVHRKARTSGSTAFEDTTSAIPRREAPEVCKNRSPSEIRGRRECRVPDAPAASHAMKKAYELVTTVTPEITRHSPRNGFTAYFALSPVTTLFDTVACASSRRLDANDWGVRTTRLGRTRQHHSSSALPASTASRPAFVTCATPLWSEPDGESVN